MIYSEYLGYANIQIDIRYNQRDEVSVFYIKPPYIKMFKNLSDFILWEQGIEVDYTEMSEDNYEAICDSDIYDYNLIRKEFNFD